MDSFGLFVHQLTEISDGRVSPLGQVPSSDEFPFTSLPYYLELQQSSAGQDVPDG